MKENNGTIGWLWPLWGVAAGALGYVGHLVTQTDVTEAGRATGVAVMNEVSRGPYHGGVVAGMLAVFCLVVLAAEGWRWANAHAPTSIASAVVTLGMTASAGASVSLPRAEERRRRDLHDGLGPALASMTLQAEAARDLVNADPGQADALLAELTAELQEATADIRRLVYGLRPPALDDLGLLPALRNHAARYGPSGPHITIVVDEPLPVLPAVVEVAAYRIVQEALTNVVHHAGATTCNIAVKLTGDHPNIDITDDGVGLPASWESGVGLRSMRERAAELGGSCGVVSSPGGGARVSALLPIWVGEQTP